MISWDEYLHLFVENYSGPPLNVVAAGAGLSISELGLIPGASRVLYSFLAPYDVKATSGLIRAFWSIDRASEFEDKAVCERSAESLALTGDYMSRKEVITVGVTGALISSRYRKGENKAFVFIFRSAESTENIAYRFSKTDEIEHQKLSIKQIAQARKEQDLFVSRSILEKFWKP